MSEYSATLLTVVVALGGFVTYVLSVIKAPLAEYIRRSLELRNQQIETERIRTAQLAAEMSVAASEEAGRTWLSHAHDVGAAKLEHAKSLARTLAPKATASVADAQLTEVVQASVAKMRASQASPSLYPPSLRPGQMLSIPVQVLESDTPTTPMPRPAKVPRDVFSGSDTPTRPDRPRQP